MLKKQVLVEDSTLPVVTLPYLTLFQQLICLSIHKVLHFMVITGLQKRIRLAVWRWFIVTSKQRAGAGRLNKADVRLASWRGWQPGNGWVEDLGHRGPTLWQNLKQLKVVVLHKGQSGEDCSCSAGAWLVDELQVCRQIGSRTSEKSHTQAQWHMEKKAKPTARAMFHVSLLRFTIKHVMHFLSTSSLKRCLDSEYTTTFRFPKQESLTKKTRCKTEL